MMKKEIALRYLEFLENGDVEQILGLFSSNGMVQSPVYGSMKATLFYPKLNNDTKSSQLKLHGIFEDPQTKNLALHFNYMWTLKNDEKVEFDVVDIIEFNAQHKISKLIIIYDTVQSGVLVKQLNA